jgi:predicted DsbA family dithiol-disulfide isomerase
MYRQVIVCLIALTAATACAQGTEGVEDEAVARFGDRTITRSELERDDELNHQLIAIRQQEYDVTRRHLEQKIFDSLLTRAAERAGLSRDEYLKQNVADRVGEPDGQAVDSMVRQFRSRLNPDPELARQQVVEALKMQREQELSEELRDRLFADAGVEILIEPVRFEAMISDAHPARGGGPDAPVTLIEYTDYQCPFCTRIQPALDEIVRRYDGKVRHVFKQLPLPSHPEAELAAEASLCAEDQGRFWELHDWLFINSRRITRDNLMEQARRLEMDEQVFSSCLDDRVHRDLVKEDIAEAQRFGISGTPGFLVNGRVLRGAQPMDEFLKLIDEELALAGVEKPKAPAS